jgi:hypothetical protein
MQENAGEGEAVRDAGFMSDKRSFSTAAQFLVFSSLPAFVRGLLFS